jgi:hypothetical protein
VIGWAAALPYPAVAGLVVIHAMLMTFDSASLTAGALAAAAPGQRGATMAVHSTLGFCCAFAGAIVFGAVLDLVGPERVAGWGAAFGAIALADAAGALLVWRWARKPAAA